MENRLTDYTQFLDKDGLRGMRLGVARKHFGFNDRVDKLMNDLLAEMKRLGAVLVDPADIPTTGKFDDSEFEVLLYEFKADLNAYLAGLGPQAPVRSLERRDRVQRKNRDREMPYFGQDIMIKAEAKGPLTSKPYLAGVAQEPFADARAGHRFRDEEAPARCARCADWWTTVAH